MTVQDTFNKVSEDLSELVNEKLGTIQIAMQRVAVDYRDGALEDDFDAYPLVCLMRIFSEQLESAMTEICAFSRIVKDLGKVEYK